MVVFVKRISQLFDLYFCCQYVYRNAFDEYDKKIQIKLKICHGIIMSRVLGSAMSMVAARYMLLLYTLVREEDKFWL